MQGATHEVPMKPKKDIRMQAVQEDMESYPFDSSIVLTGHEAEKHVM